MHCPHCGRETPDGVFCVHCGASLAGAASGTSGRRLDAYAAHPTEHVLHPSVATTLFPRLTPRQVLQVRWLLLMGALVVLLIGLGRLVPLAIVLGALLLPLLYLAYFVVATVYADEPLPVLLATFVAGAVLGALLSVGAFRVILSQRRLGFGVSPGYVLLTGVVLPLVAQALMLVGPTVLYVTRPRFHHVLDGLVFGAASGLGFAAAQSIIYSWLLILGPFQQCGSATTWVLPVLRIALFVPLLDAATTGLICAAFWVQRGSRAEARGLGWLATPGVAPLIGGLGQVVPSLGYNLLGGQIMALVWYGVAALVLLLLVRLLVHDGLQAAAGRSGTAPGPVAPPSATPPAPPSDAHADVPNQDQVPPNPENSHE